MHCIPYSLIYSLTGVECVMLHKNQYKILFSQVQDAFRCRLRNCQDPINADSSSSFPNGHAQIMVSFYFFFDY